MNILEKLAQSSKEIDGKNRKDFQIPDIKRSFKFKNALKQDGLSFICELKKASPSKGILNKEFAYLKLLSQYQQAGASAVSCLTETTKFLGSLKILNEVCKNTSLPVLRKDFLTLDYQVFQAYENGASALLLIASILDYKNLVRLLNLTHSFGLDALVEVHNKEDLEKALDAGSEIIGINNRDLKDFTVDLITTEKLRPKIPKDKVVVSESGILSRNDLRRIIDIKCDAVLIGEAFVKSKNIKETMKEFKSET